MARRKIKSKGPIKLTYMPPDIPKLKPEQQLAIVKRLGEAFVLLVQSDTQDGLDANLQPFEPYSALYERIKTAGGKFVGHVNMTVSGQMLRSMIVAKVSRTRFSIGFNDQSATTTGKTLLESAWGKLAKEDRSAIWAMAGAAKAKAGKSRGVRGRRSPVSRKPKVQGPPISGAPAPRNSEKALWTNRLRPWLTIGPLNGARFKEMQAIAVELVAAELKARL